MTKQHQSPDLEIVWDARVHAPQLLQARPELASIIEALGEAPWIVQDLAPFDNGVEVRPFRHLRAFYRRIPTGVIAVKGSEPLAGYVEPHLDAMQAFRIEYPGRGRSLFSALEHFPLVEQKIPLAVTVAEALEDTHAAVQVQSAYLTKFNTLASVPLPLAIVRWPTCVAELHLEKLKPRLSQRAMRIVEKQIEGGLGALIYFYPCVPLRVAHLPTILGSAHGASAWRSKVSTLCDPQITIDRWIDLVARLLVLGFMPSSIESIGVGHCLEMKNAVIDGGFVDLGSIIDMDLISSDQMFSETMLATIADLTKTVRHLLLGDIVDVEAEYRNPSLVFIKLMQHLLPALSSRVLAYSAKDPRVTHFFNQSDFHVALENALGALYPSTQAQRGHE